MPRLLVPALRSSESLLPRHAEGARTALETLLVLMDREVTSRGGRFVVVALPSKAQVEPSEAGPDINRSLELLEITEEQFSFHQAAVLEIALASAARAGVPIINPLPAMAEAAQSAPLYYPRDWHLSPTGQRVLADVLAEELTRRSLVPQYPNAIRLRK